MKGQKDLGAEEELSGSQLSEATDTITSKRRNKELKGQKFHDQACSNERRFINQCQRGNAIAFVGGRGHSIGSRIKRVDNTLKINNGTSVCTNPAYILLKSGSSHKERDAISSLAIGLSGVSYLALGVPFPSFSPSVGHHHTGFTDITTIFLTRSVARLELDELNT
ncbi:hypothetical protein INT46_009180 [Mucor plumbeus]|uniref:Uncharacterized protein n=1 Tax=Mucor plumbeus TaxID=97098 RepID=A0A8H7R9V8_9FUNG|nr:hypothetical protein INT46_009180 [Mucor plumbeus]